MWILKQIWKKERNYFTCLETFYFFLNKAIDFQINEVWSLVITPQSQCQQLPCFYKYCSLQGGAVLCVYDTLIRLVLLFRVALKIYIEPLMGHTRLSWESIARHCYTLWMKMNHTYFLPSKSSSFSGDHGSLGILVYFPQSAYYMIPQISSNTSNFFQETMVFHV